MTDSTHATDPAANGDPLPHAPDGHPAIRQGRTGVLLIALGTPDAPTVPAVRRYLREFLGDPRVVELPRALWLPILYGPILTFRPRKSAAAYARIWDHERDESPLRTVTRDQADGLAGRLGDDVMVDWAFTYGTPSIDERLRAMRQAGCDRLLLFPLYPHYSATTTAAALDRVFLSLRHMRWQPAIRTMPAFHDDPVYIDALARSVRAELDGLDWTPDRIIASYHSIPKDYWDKGDPYPCQCKKTSRLLREALGWSPDNFLTTYQSRVGPKEWVSPYTDKAAEQLGAEGVKKIAVLAPAFTGDCLETLEELNMELRETFAEAGGTHFHYIPCLNASEPGLDVLDHTVRRELQGWV
ncbi:ferrochelatase [Yunchengibacter salinarum]|uniref:ferrochelatase n=1 Tax=Yunchengibacter salinarum TaxID=3133399 RepID=UPI0035B5818C